MPKGLRRYYGTGDLHFITCSCYRRKPWLDTHERRDLFLRILEKVRTEHRFVVLGYVVMPEHFHLLISEPQVGTPSTAMQSVKQRFAQRVLTRRRQRVPRCLPPFGKGREIVPMPIWQPRFYDFNVWTEHKRIEKLRYIHRNPVKRGLVEQPELWRWSSLDTCRG
jgi:putative transposase